MPAAPLSIKNLVIAIAVGLIFAGAVSEISSGVRSGIIAPLGDFLFGGSPTLKVGPFDMGQASGGLISGAAGLITAVLIFGLLLRWFWRPLAKFLRVETTHGN